MNIVDVLCEVDMATLAESLEQSDFGLVRMLDGQPPTTEQRDLIMQAGPEHFDAAMQEMQARVVRAQNAVFPAERIAALMEKYHAAPGEPLGVVAKRMSFEDLQELRSLIPWLTEDERSTP